MEIRNIKYKCVQSNESDLDFLIGESKTIEMWKYWLITMELDRYYSFAHLFDLTEDNSIVETLKLNETQVIPYLEEMYDVKMQIDDTSIRDKNLFKGERIVDNTKLNWKEI